MSREFTEFVKSYPREVAELALRVRELIFEAGPSLSEHVYPAMGVVRYGTQGNKVTGLALFLMPTKSGVSLGFHHDTSLPDPDQLLEGTGKNLRHVKLRTKADADSPSVRALVEAELARAGR